MVLSKTEGNKSSKLQRLAVHRGRKVGGQVLGQNSQRFGAAVCSQQNIAGPFRGVGVNKVPLGVGGLALIKAGPCAGKA